MTVAERDRLEHLGGIIACSHPALSESSNVAGILYGLPHFTPELERELEEKRVVWAGCNIPQDAPAWQCVDCGHCWGRVGLSQDGDGNVYILRV